MAKWQQATQQPNTLAVIANAYTQGQNIQENLCLICNMNISHNFGYKSGKKKEMFDGFTMIDPVWYCFLLSFICWAHFPSTWTKSNHTKTMDSISDMIPHVSKYHICTKFNNETIENEKNKITPKNTHTTHGKFKQTYG